MKYVFTTILYKRYDNNLKEDIFFTEKQIFSFNSTFTIEELQYRCSLRSDCEFQSIIELSEVQEDVVASLSLRVHQV